ncbi:ATP-binding protein [Actinoplanes couchii]|uniref:ATP-binding protein n=1 Tax=Actinoplanes couchii TaxID=403638 RepID=UPI001945A7CB|nr:hypothetical protein [Actinoplanes couchii]MDR6324060.1 hypothetical protein [Actinoplanes couchii]
MISANAAATYRRARRLTIVHRRRERASTGGCDDGIRLPSNFARAETPLVVERTVTDLGSVNDAPGRVHPKALATAGQTIATTFTQWADTDAVLGYGARMVTAQASRPPADAVPLHTWVLGDQAQVHGLGAAVLSAVTEQVAATAVFTFGAVVDKVVLVATELAANAVRRGSPPTVVQLSRCMPDLILDIGDHDTQMLPEFADTRPPGASGLGLRLAQRYALTVGWYVTDTTRHIWARFPLDDRATIGQSIDPRRTDPAVVSPPAATPDG